MCKAIIQVGPRKGELCKFPESENGYCVRHQRNFQYDTKVKEGKHLCRFFFRGCDTEITEEDHKKGISSCVECRAKLQKKQYACEHEGCPFKVKEPGFCKKHQRDTYKKEEQEKGIRYCDIARGCFAVCEEGKSSCSECLEKARHIDNERYSNRKQLTEVLQNTIVSDSSICVNCGKDFETFKTRYNKPSKNCKACAQTQKNQDAKRADRVRNYKKEHMKKIEQFYKIYIHDSARLGKGIFHIDFETFSEMVKSPCYYCKYTNTEEVNGIDRVDNDKGYTKENCVSCCATCNRMKHYYHPSFFIQKCKIICKDLFLYKNFITQWDTYCSRKHNQYYITYKKNAESRNLVFNLSETQFYNIIKSPCYLCGFQSDKGIGIDRVNNLIREYSILSARPCCWTCNDFKHTLDLDSFIEKCKQISDTWPTTERFDSIPVPKNPLKDYIEKGRATETKDRKVWRAAGLYYALLSNSAQEFEEKFKEVLKPNELTTLTAELQQKTKEDAIEQLKTYIQTLKKRKQRLPPK